MAYQSRALIVEESSENLFSMKIGEKSIPAPTKNHVVIRVHYSSLNYKDALSARGHKGITRHYPHTPGIDAAGIVEESASPNFKVGDHVLVNGFDLGMNTSGGFSEYILVPDDWVVKMPDGLSIVESKMLGTAGFTAAMAIHEIHSMGITPDDGQILVTGGTGGVGSLATMILAKLGYNIACSTRKTDSEAYLHSLGCSEIIYTDSISAHSDKPLLQGRWIAAIDNLGGEVLANIIKSTKQYGIVLSVGNALSDAYSSTVYPFILRGITIKGIESGQYPMPKRLHIWSQLAGPWKPDNLDSIIKEVTLDHLEPEIQKILKGGQIGRVLVNLKA